MASTTVNDSATDSYEAREARRLACQEHEKQALLLGDHDKSLRNGLMSILTAGRCTTQSEGDDMTAERALLKWTAAVTKAISIALMHQPMVEDSHDLVFYDEDAGMALAGVSSLLEVAPSLISAFHHADVDVVSAMRRRENATTAEVQP
ncbi:MAG TPA: hypothetical protein VHB79_10405 [Polyangiaceae bacterium]|nr:hypothetical protein [Polyangiaceae bacterium]